MIGTSRAESRAGRVAQGVVALVLALVIIPGSITALVTFGIWPGEVLLLAPLFCDDEHPDAFVVADHESFAGETATNYTLMCVGPRGGAKNAGLLEPALVLTAGHAVVWLVALTLGSAVYERRRSSRANSSVREFVETDCDQSDPDAFTRRSQLYRVYVDWCRERGRTEATFDAFHAELRRDPEIEIESQEGQVGYVGISHPDARD